ncbi:hypothetical protein LIER_10819 [Lithospermum erythrorhizon]|jgi:hypothetical protein
MRML